MDQPDARHVVGAAGEHATDLRFVDEGDGTAVVPMAVSPDSGTWTTEFMLTWASGADPVVASDWSPVVSVTVR